MVAVANTPFSSSIALLPSNGLSDVTGIMVETMFKNIVKLRRIVTPGKCVDELSLLIILSGTVRLASKITVHLCLLYKKIVVLMKK